MNLYPWKRIVLFIFLLFCVKYSYLQADTRENRYRISLLTYDEGQELYAIFGHSAIRVIDHLKGTDQVYNYGTFDFGSSNFYFDFLKGILTYRLSKQPTNYVINKNLKENRRIVDCEFILSQEQLNKLAEILEINYLPQNREYFYDFFYDNCATRILNVLVSVHNFENSKTYPTYSKKSFRKHIMHYLTDKPWTRIGINILLGLSADKVATPIQTVFLPNLLLTFLAENKDILSQNKEILVPGERYIKDDKKGASIILFVICFATALVSIWERLNYRNIRIITHLIFWPAILIGILIMILWGFSDLKIYSNNMNLLWANPMLLLVLFRKKVNYSWIAIIFTLQIIGVVYTIFFTNEYAFIYYSMAISIRLLLSESNGDKRSVPNIV